MPYMPRSIFWLILLCIFLLVLAHLAHSAEPEGWDRLLRNEPDKAADYFSRQLSDTENKPAVYEGLYQAQLLQGNIGQAYATLKEQVQSCGGKPLQGLLLLRLGVVSDQSGKVADFYNFVRELSGNSETDAYTRTIIALILNQASLRHNRFTQAGEELGKSSRLLTFSRVIGPVKTIDKYGLSYPTAVERDVAAASLTLSLDRRNVAADPSGKLKLGNILPMNGEAGVAYVYVTLDAVKEMPAVLDVISGSICSVWLNGYSVSSDVLYSNGFITARNGRSIGLQQGKNLLLIKIFKNDTLQLSLRDPVTGGKLSGVKVLPYEAADWQEAKVYNYSGRIFSAAYVQPFIAEFEAQQDLASRFWLAFFYEYTSNYADGIGMISALLQNYPDSALINYTAGEYYQGYSNIYESKPRTVSMCEKYMRNAITLFPGYIQPKLTLSRIYLASKQESSALKLLKEIGEQNSQFPWVYRALAEQYAQKGWIMLASKMIGRYYELYPDNMADVINFYLDINEAARAQKLFDQTEVAGADLTLYDRFKLLLRFNRIEEAQAALKEWYGHFPQEQDLCLSGMIELAQYRGDYTQVAEYLQESIKSNPENALVIKAYAENLLRQGKNDEALKEFENARATGMKFAPSLTGLVRRIEFDRGDYSELSDYDIALSAVPYSEVKSEDHGRAGYANLINVKVVKVFADLSAEIYEHKAFKVFNNDGISELAELDVGPGEIIECRTIGVDGEEYVPESSENISLDKAISMYNVSPGAVLEYSKRQLVDAVTVFKDRFEFESFNNPTIKSRYVFIIPRNMLSVLDISGINPELVSAGDYVVMRWDEGTKEGIEPEDFMPKLADILEGIEVTVYSGKQQAPGLLAVDKPVLTLPELDAKARDLCKNLDSTRDKVKTLYSWIARNIQKSEIGRSARDAYIMSAGTAESRLKLLQAMLKAVGVDSYPLLSNIPFSIAGQQTLEDRVASMTDFTLPALLRVENTDKLQPDIWVGINDEMRESRPGDIGTLNQGALSLEYSPFGVRFSAVRENDLEGIVLKTPEYTISADGSAAVQGGVKFYGATAVGPRKVLYNSVQAQQYAAKIAAQIFPGIIDAKYSYPSVAELQAGADNWVEPLIVGFKGRVLNFCSSRGKDMYFNPFTGGTFIANLIVKQPRLQPIVIQKDIQNFLSKSFEIPQGYAYMNVPMDRVIKSSFGVFMLDYNVRGPSLVVSGSFLLPAQEIAPEDSKLFNRFLAEIKEAVDKGVTIRKIDVSESQEVFDQGIPEAVVAGELQVKNIPENIKKLEDMEGTE